MAADGPKTIFISYRHHDTGDGAVRLHEALDAQLEVSLTLDEKVIALGGNIGDALGDRLQKADLLLVLIGKSWDTFPNNRRGMPINDKADWVRWEMESALHRQPPPVIVVVWWGTDPWSKEDIDQINAPEIARTMKESLYNTIGSNRDSDIRNLVERLANEQNIPLRRTAPQPAARVADARWEASYLHSVDTTLDRIEAAVQLPGRPGSVRLVDVYTPLALHQPNRPAAASLDWEALCRPDRVALTGDAGSGKSTLLRYLALQLASRRLALIERGDLRATEGLDAPLLPVHVELARFGHELDDTPESWLKRIGILLDLGVDEASGLLRRGGVMLLVDGLDEVPDPRERVRILQGLSLTQSKYNAPNARNRVIVTCRNAAWGSGDPFASFEQIALEPMDRTVTDSFLRNWCQAIWGDRATTVQCNLGDTLRQSPELARVAQNPQMAAMLAILEETDERRDRSVPRERALLYRRFVQRLIHGDQDRHLRQLITLALQMQRSSPQSGERLNVLRAWEADRLLASAGNDGDGSPGSLQELAVQTGLLEMDGRGSLSRSNDLVRFKHRTFQEFLTAQHYVREPGDLPDLMDRAMDPAWAEVLAFCAGLLADERPQELSDFLEKVLETPPPGASDEALVAWAPRLTAASACLIELASYPLDEGILAPVIAAQTLAERLLQQQPPAIDLRARLKIAEGLGAVRDPRLRSDLRWVPVGGATFVRGSAAEDAWPHEGPPARVTVADYWIQRWPVTVAEFEAFLVADDGYALDQWWDKDAISWHRAHQGPAAWDQIAHHRNHPVSGVSWWEARAYCRWYDAVAPRGEPPALPEGHVVQLPTEAQWEHAAHPDPAAAGLERGPVYPWGTDWPEEPRANLAGCGLEHAAPTPVGLFGGGSGRLDLWDLAGNVNEHCLDGFAAYPEAPGRDPIGAEYRHGAALRGGSFQSSGLDLRITARRGLDRGEQCESVGFRCAAVRGPRA
jgi:formylglycine-generating enzyme required for sulfatase activity